MFHSLCGVGGLLNQIHFTSRTLGDSLSGFTFHYMQNWVPTKHLVVLFLVGIWIIFRLVYYLWARLRPSSLLTIHTTQIPHLVSLFKVVNTPIPRSLIIPKAPFCFLFLFLVVITTAGVNLPRCPLAMFTFLNPVILTHSNQGESSKEKADGTGWRQPLPHHHSETWFRCERFTDTNFLGRVFVDDGWPPPAVLPVPEQGPQRDQDTFLATVISLLPDVCPDYAQQQGHACGWDSELFLNRILEEEGNGTKYPRRVKKRKRDDADVGDNAKESKLQKLHKKYEGRVSQHHRDHNYSRVW